MKSDTLALLGMLQATGLAKAQWQPVVQECDSISNGYQCFTNISHLWGQYSPYFEVPSEISSAIPKGCEISFVQVLSRHGARDPTASKTKVYNETIRAIQQNATSFNGKYSFLKNFKYTLGADQLTAFGQQEMVNSGALVRKRYPALSQDNIPFVRSSGEARVVESAQNWTQGFSDNSHPNLPLLVISEDEGVNNTLSHGLCTNFEEGPDSDIGDNAKATFAKTFVPSIQSRLEADLPGVKLSSSQVIYLMDLCPFVVVASEGGNDLSPFCNLFTEQEWQDYNYYESLDKYYGYGNGNPLGPTQGVGWVNELLARLTKSPVRGGASVNETLDSDPQTFPLDRKLYADFSHDNDMTAIFAAMGLYNHTTALSNTTIVEAASKAGAGYSAAWTVPFASRMYVEKMTCRGHSEELVRVIINGRVVPLVGCNADSLGRCGLSDFVASQGFSKSGGKWGQCFD